MVPRRLLLDCPLHRMQAGCTNPLPLAWSVLCCIAGHGSITGTRPYIPYYNRRLPCPVQRPVWQRYLGIFGGAALDGMPSSVAQVVYMRLVWLLYCVRCNGANQRKIPCEALRAVLRCGWYNCINGTKRTVNACMRCIAAGQNKSPAFSADARQKKSPASVGGAKLLFMNQILYLSKSAFISLSSYSVSE